MFDCFPSLNKQIGSSKQLITGSNQFAGYFVTTVLRF